MTRKRRPSQFNRRVERQFEKRLMSAVRLIARIVANADSPATMVQALEYLAQTDTYQEWSQRQAYQMAKSVKVSNAQSWREAVQKGTKSERIFSMLSVDVDNMPEYQQLLLQQAEWIQSLPRSTAEEVSKLAGRAALEGKRPLAIMATLQAKAPQMATYKVRRIARTEVAKANALVTELRANRAGVGWYVWNTVSDQRVRSSHDNMDGVLCRFDSPPCPEKIAGIDGNHSYYNPGGIYNCRCFAEPVVILEQVAWPAKVYYNGTITRMSRRQFEKIAQ